MIAFARGLRGCGLRDEPIQASGVEVVSHDARDFGSGFRHAESKEASEFGIFVQVFFCGLRLGRPHFAAFPRRGVSSGTRSRRRTVPIFLGLRSSSAITSAT